MSLSRSQIWHKLRVLYSITRSPRCRSDWGDRQAERFGGLALVVTAWKELGRISRMPYPGLGIVAQPGTATTRPHRVERRALFAMLPTDDSQPRHAPSEPVTPCPARYPTS